MVFTERRVLSLPLCFAVSTGEAAIEETRYRVIGVHAGRSPITTMTKEQRQQSLTAARDACKWLRFYIMSANITDERITISVGPPAQSYIAALLKEFIRLDHIEQRQIEERGMNEMTTLATDRPPTPAERASEILWLMLHDQRAVLRELITQQITAAEEECAKIAEEENERCESAADAVANNPFTTIDESTGYEMAAKAARRIMLKIRARSAASPADTEGEKE